MHADTDTGADVTARALAFVEAARKRAIWADDFVMLNADRRDRTRMEMREIRADLATDSARAELALLVADVPLLAAVAIAAIRYRQSEERHRAMIAADPKRADRLMDDASQTVMTDRAALDAAIRAAGEAA